VVAFNTGHFGGAIFRIAEGGGGVVELNRSAVAGLFPTDRGVLAPLGGIGPNGVLRIAKDGDGRWRISKVLDLDDDVLTGALDAEGALLLATELGLFRIDSYGCVLAKHEFGVGRILPIGLHVTSSGDIYVGAAGAVLQLRAGVHGHAEQWLLPPLAPPGGRVARPASG
jgi:hypothetical protein